MRRLAFRVHLRFLAAAVCALCLFAPSAAQAASVFDVGPGGYADSVDSHLPAWLQVDAATASLYTSDGSGDESAAKLARHTFLRVLGAGISRLQVQAYDETGGPAATG